jgi:hypothetical protein
MIKIIVVIIILMKIVIWSVKTALYNKKMAKKTNKIRNNII